MGYVTHWHRLIRVISLDPIYKWNFKQVIFKLILVIDDWCISYEIALSVLSLDLTDGKFFGSDNGLVLLRNKS